MKVIRCLIMVILLSATSANASSYPVGIGESSSSLFGWRTVAFFAGAVLANTNLFPCIEVPETTSFNNSSKTLLLQEAGQWKKVGDPVDRGKLIKFSWDNADIEPYPRKYLLLYRIDPRLSKPEIFIQTYDYEQKKYVSDFHQYVLGAYIQEKGLQDKNLAQVMHEYNSDSNFSRRIKDYKNYFNVHGKRPTIKVSQGDIINITLIDMERFLGGNNTDFTAELNDPALTASSLSLLYTNTSSDGNMDNKIIYASADSWCQTILENNKKIRSAITSKPQDLPSSLVCKLDGKYQDTENLWPLLVGKPVIPQLINMQDLIRCESGLNTQELNPLCFYDKGRGMVIKAGSNIIKTSDQSFVDSDLLKKDFLYYRVDSGKELDLDIGTDWQIDGMFSSSNNFKQLMTDWNYQNVNEFNTAITNESNVFAANFLHFGRYIMQVEIGNGDFAITSMQQNIQVEYTIVPKGASAPSQSSQGTNVSHDFSTNAESDGDLYIRVINPDGQGQGSVTINIANYTGTTWFSDVIAGKIVIPLRDKFQKLSKQFYIRLAGNATMQYISKVMLTLYVMLYGLFFLAGVTKISVRDIVIRVVKISIVIALFSEHSWNFFNNNLFQIFVSGSDYLFNNVVGLTSSKNNIFGFVDPIFDKYTNSRIWGLLFIQLLQIHNGLTFFALMTMCSVLLYFIAVLEVIIGYVLAFLGLSVMIGLAPFFITFMLFERTKSFFTNWISVLFNYMIQPTILLIFFLLIDQIMSEQLAKAVVRSCWDILISIKINLDLNHIGIPLNIPFTLPFLPGIPFYVPAMLSVTDISNVSMGGSFLAVATSSLLFYAYCLMANGLVSYVTTVISYLTNVQPARLPGKGLQSSVNPTESVMEDMQKAVSPVTNVAKSIGKGFKERVIDQKYGKGASESDESDRKSYSNEIRSGSRHDVRDDDSGKANSQEGTGLGGRKDRTPE